MYLTFIVLHSLVRWLVLLFGVIAVVRAFAGWRSRRRWMTTDDRMGWMFVMSVDVQTLLGLILYGLLSPITRTALSNMGAAMGDPLLRFYAVEHLTLMIAALVLAHIGRARTRKAAADAARHRTAAIFFAIALVLILVGIPWPFRAVGRPLLPGF
jgi:hypothetical protein